MKPRLTNKVLQGLAFLAGLVEAGGSADIIGTDEDAMNAEERANWRAILRACEWTREMQQYKQERSHDPH